MFSVVLFELQRQTTDVCYHITLYKIGWHIYELLQSSYLLFIHVPPYISDTNLTYSPNSLSLRAFLVLSWTYCCGPAIHILLILLIIIIITVVVMWWWGSDDRNGVVLGVLLSRGCSEHTCWFVYNFFLHVFWLVMVWRVCICAKTVHAK